MCITGTDFEHSENPLLRAFVLHLYGDILKDHFRKLFSIVHNLTAFTLYKVLVLKETYG